MNVRLLVYLSAHLLDSSARNAVLLFITGYFILVSVLCHCGAVITSDGMAAVSWNSNSLSGWEIAEDGSMRSNRLDATLESRGSLRRDFAVRFRFRFGPEIPQEYPFWVRFRSTGSKSEYSLGFHKSLGMLLSASGKGQIAGLPPVPWPSDSTYALKPNVWYEVRLQAVADRISVKLWQSDQEEPNYWVIDILDSTFSGGALSVLGMKSVEMSSVILEEPEKLSDPVIEDLRRLRFKRNPWQETDFQIHERSDEIEIQGERVRIIFSRSGSSVSKAYLRGELFSVGYLPDVRYVTANGTEYRQSFSNNGQLDSTGWDGKYFVLEGLCRPADKNGQPGPANFEYKYRIHRDLGIVLVSARCLQKVPVRRLEFVNCLEDRPEQGVDYLHCSLLWAGSKRHRVVIKDRWGQGRGSINLGPLPRDDKVIAGEQMLFGRWTSDKVGFEVQGMSYYGSEFSQASPETKREKVLSIEAGGYVYTKRPVGGTMLDDLTSEKYLVARSRDGKRSLDLVFINLAPKDTPVGIGRAEYTFGFQFLPFRKYRPKLWLNGYMPLYSSAVEMDSISRRETIARECARMGLQATHLGVGHLPHTVLDDRPTDQKRDGRRRIKKCVEALHAAGLRVAPGWWWASWDCDDYIKNGWLTPKDVARGQIINWGIEPDRGGIRRGAYPHSYWIDICYNDKKIRDTLLEKLLFGFVNQLGCDGVYLDGFVPSIPCDNRLHGCMGSERQVEGYIELIDGFIEQSKKVEPIEAVLWGHPGEHVYGPLGLADISYLGEMFVPPWVPNKAELAGYFSSLLYGSQVVYCSAPGNGGPDWEDVRTYEGALSRCSLVQAPNPVVNAWFEGKENYIGLKLWQRSMMPLGIYDINNSEVHHPFDQDYSDYAHVPEDGATAILYHRPADILLVVVREIQDPSQMANVTLTAPTLGFEGNEVLVFDIANGTLKKIRIKDNQIELGTVDLGEGPRLFHLVTKKAVAQVVWHDQVVWNVKAETKGQQLILEAEGVPESQGIIYIACAKQPKVKNGKLLNYDRNSSLAAVRINFDSRAKAGTILTW